MNRLPGSDPPLAGRRAELGTLERELERAFRERACSVVSVRGEAGLGKTRLALELAQRVGDDARVLFADCPPYADGVPLWPLTDLLGQLPAPTTVVGGSEGELVAERLAKGRMDECFLAVRTLLEAVAAERPLIVVVEDAQWAQPTFLELVDHLARRTRGAAILVLLLARTARAASAGATEIHLGPLGRAECEELLEGLGVDAASESGARMRIARAASGNPLFVEQAAALFADGRPPPRGELPATLAGLATTRVARLPAGARAIAQCAAVEGLVFHGRAVAELAPGEWAAEAHAQLRTLVELKIIRPWPATLGGEEGFRFRHRTLRDAVYAATPERVHGALHERYADWRTRIAPRGHDDDGIAGYHLERAFRALVSSAPPARRDELARRAAKRLAVGGRRAYSRVDRTGEAAPRLLARAAALVPSTDPLRRSLLPTLAAAHGDAGDGAAAAAAIRDGRALAAATGDRWLAARLAVEDAWLRFHVDPETELGDALCDVEAALPVLEEVGDDAGAGRALYAQGTLLFSVGRAGPALEPLERAVAHARKAEDYRLDVDAVWQLAGPMYWGPMPVEEALALSDELRRQLPPGSQADSFMVVLEAIFLAMVGRFDEARERREEGRAMYDAIGVAGADVGLPQYSSRLDLLAGDVEQAVAELQGACDAYERRGETGYLTSTAAMLAEALYRLGRDEDAIRAARTAERTAAPDDFSAQMLWRSVRGKILARRGDHATGERLAREAVAIGDTSDYLFMRADARLDLAEVLRAAGRDDEAANAAQAALDLYERKGELASIERTRAFAGGVAVRSSALA